MPVNEDAEWRKLFIGLMLAFLSVGMIALVFTEPADSCESSGYLLIAVGAIWAALHKAIGHWRFWLETRLPLGSDLWKRLGLQGLQSFDLGIGLVLIGGGCLLLIKFYVSHLSG